VNPTVKEGIEKEPGQPEWRGPLLEELREVMKTVIRDEMPKLLGSACAVEPNSSRPKPAPAAQSQNGPPKPVDPSVIVAEAASQQAAELEKDRKEQAASENDLRQWNNRIEELRQAVKFSVQACGNILARAKQTLDSLPVGLRGRLQSRQEALDLIGKMLGRLEANLPTTADLPGKPLASVDEGSLRTLLVGITEEGSARDIVRSKLKLGATERYQHVTQLRHTAEKNRKAFFGFLTRLILPILDGLDEGERTSHALTEELKVSQPDTVPALERWFQCYADLRQVLLAMLEKFQVRRIAVTAGAVVEYDRHEPFDVEAAPGLQNEQIKSVVRQGYEYNEDETPVVLRPAQVIVVKN
jgi:molecular chaperone GrpE (heat shock protein)